MLVFRYYGRGRGRSHGGGRGQGWSKGGNGHQGFMVLVFSNMFCHRK